MMGTVTTEKGKTMIDLISRQDALFILSNLNSAWVGYEKVSRLPTIDAVPVKHGEWIDPAAADCYRCSVCEEYTQMEMPRLLYHYCPNCGAKMDGEK